MYNNQSNYAFTGNPNQAVQQQCGNGISMPQEPSIVRTATELLGHIASLESELDNIRTKVYGPTPTGNAAGGNQTVLSLQELVNIACSRVASLVGDARTINSGL